MFLKIFRSLETLCGESGIRTWLYRITLNHCRNLRSGWCRRTMVNNIEDALDAGPSAPSDDPIHVLESKELGELIRQTLDQTRRHLLQSRLHQSRHEGHQAPDTAVPRT